LESEKKIEFKDNNHDAFLVYKFSPDKIAHSISEWAKRTGRQDRIETVFWLITGEDTEEEIFHNMPEEIVIKAIKILQDKGKCKVITDFIKFILIANVN